MEDNWIYVGAFLDKESQTILKNSFILPTGWIEYFDHMTLVYNDGTPCAEAAKSICEKLIKTYKHYVNLEVVAQGISDTAYAVLCTLPSGIPCTNKVAHITLGCATEGKPVESNYIVNWHMLTQPITLKAIIEIYRPANLQNDEDPKNRNKLI